MSTRNQVVVAAMALLLALPGASCTDEPVTGAKATGSGAPKAPRAAKGKKGKGGKVPATAPSSLPALPVREFHPRDFDESELSRDPFRSFEDMYRAQAQRKVVIQREVLASRFSLDQLRIVGIVTGQAGRIMMSDPSGFGWVIKSGDFVGRPEVVRTGGPSGSEVAVNWRLDRIRPNDAIFVREDPTRPDVPATTRVVSMRTDSELNPEIRTGIRGGGSGSAPPLGADGSPVARPAPLGPDPNPGSPAPASQPPQQPQPAPAPEPFAPPPRP